MASARDFAAKQNQSADVFIAADLSAEALAEAEEGMKQMSEKFRETGSELYMGAGGREHD